MPGELRDTGVGSPCNAHFLGAFGSLEKSRTEIKRMAKFRRSNHNNTVRFSEVEAANEKVEKAGRRKYF